MKKTSQALNGIGREILTSNVDYNICESMNVRKNFSCKMTGRTSTYILLQPMQIDFAGQIS